MKDKAKGGRLRCDRAREAVLQAAHRLLRQESGAGLTMAALAREAAVGKPTIYRWWPSLADVVLEALLEQADADIPVPPYSTLEVTLGEFMRRSMRAAAQGAGPHLRFLMAQAQEDDGFQERFREQFVNRRRAALKGIFEDGVKAGDIRPDCNLDTVVDLVFGAMWYRLLVVHAPLDEALADELTSLVAALGR